MNDMQIVVASLTAAAHRKDPDALELLAATSAAFAEADRSELLGAIALLTGMVIGDFEDTEAALTPIFDLQPGEFVQHMLTSLGQHAAGAS